MDTKKAFPPGYTTKVLPNLDDAGPGWAWGAMILPYIEEAAVHDQVNLEAAIESDAGNVRLKSLPVFICPSDGMFEQVIDIPEKKSERVLCQMAAANYVASAGTVRPTCKICRDHFDGVFGRNRPIEPRELEDGLSKTLAVGERSSHWSRAVMWGVVPNSKLLDNQQPGKYAGGPGYVLGTTFKEGFNIETLAAGCRRKEYLRRIVRQPAPGRLVLSVLRCGRTIRLGYNRPSGHEHTLHAPRPAPFRQRTDHPRQPVLNKIRSDVRDEIKRRIDQRDKYSVQLTIILSAIVGVAFSAKGREGVLLAAPIASIYFTALILYSYRIHDLLARYLRQVIEPRLANLANVPMEIEWEQYYRGQDMPGIRRRFFLVALWGVTILSLAVLIALTYHDRPFLWVVIGMGIVYLATCVAVQRNLGSDNARLATTSQS